MKIEKKEVKKNEEKMKIEGEFVDIRKRED
jgi:hypothetical protein